MINDILIVGGGTAGWMVAAALSHVYKDKCRIRLVESDQIGTVGVGEATIPVIQKFNQMLGIDENDFIKHTQGTFKLGIQFVNWGSLGNSYVHPFGAYGMNMGYLSFYNYWLRLSANKEATNQHARDPSEFSIAIQAALRGRFMPPAKIPNSPLSQISYAYHFDAGLYAQYLRRFAEARGVERIEGEITKVALRSDDGFVEKIILKTGESLGAQLFIDCTGFRGLLIEQAMNTGYDDWSHWLPCDTAVALPTQNVSDPLPYTRSTAHTAGWQWRIPLQHRTGNGHVFCSKYMSDDQAKKVLLEGVEGNVLAEPRFIRFKTGMRRKFWNKNCVAMGLASGFLEPLESTSIHLIQSSISKLIALLPAADFNQAIIDKYNELLTAEFTYVRDFIILHYKASQRTDSKFWNYCRLMQVPDTLQKKLDLYESSGRLFRDNNELFDEVSWFAVMQGQGLTPKNYHPLADQIEEQEFQRLMHEIKSVINRAADAMPTHMDYIKQHCAANSR
ncbi:tryptophan halogenase family protein [Cellvibrio sp.]